MKNLFRSLALIVMTATGSFAAEVAAPPQQKWSFSGPFGKFDQAQLQRGLQVYKEVCAACHGLDFVSFGNLSDKGGLGYSKAQSEAFAADYKIKDLDDKGQPIERNGRPADRFPNPAVNKLQAEAAHGKAPPDLSLMAKARSYERGFPFSLDIFNMYQEQGPDYLYALLNGYGKPPAGFKVTEGAHYNSAYPGNLIAMSSPLENGRVDYSDGSPKTVSQYSKDVTAFLMWTAEPKMEERKRIGFQVIIFLLFLTTLLYFTKKKVWKDVH
jgi:cytochrome c1